MKCNIKKILHIFLWIIVVSFIYMKVFMTVDIFTSSIIRLILYFTIGVYVVYIGYTKKALNAKVLGIILIVVAVIDFLFIYI